MAQSHYRLERESALVPGAWTLLQDIPLLPRSPYAFIDPAPVTPLTQRYYRAVLIQ